MAETFVILVDRCRMELNPCFFEGATLANIRNVLKYLFQQPRRNEETIAALGGYLLGKVAETKIALDADPSNKHIKHTYDRYSKIIAHYETLKTKNRA